MEIQTHVFAKYDQIVGWDKGNGDPGDADYRPAGPKDRCHHLTIGKVGDFISGGIYIKIEPGVQYPDQILIRLPHIPMTEIKTE